MPIAARDEFSIIMANLGKALRSAGYSSLFVAIRSHLQPFAAIRSHLRADPCSPWTLSDEGI